MECRVSTASGRAQLSSFRFTETHGNKRDHAYLSLIRLATPVTDPVQVTQSHQHLIQCSSAVKQQLSALTRTHQRPALCLIGSLAMPSGCTPSEGLLPTVSLDAAWHLAALPEARGLGGTNASLLPLVPAAVQCFSADSTSCAATPAQATAAVSPVVDDSVTSLTADFALTGCSEAAASPRVSGLTTRPARLAGASQQPSGQAATIMYSVVWQAAAPVDSCSAGSAACLPDQSAASAVGMGIFNRQALRASASALAALQNFSTKTVVGQASSVRLLNTSAESVAGEALAAVLRSAALEQGNGAAVSCHSGDALHRDHSRRAAKTRLSVSVTAAMASTQTAGRLQGSRCAAGVQHIPRLLPVVSRADASVQVAADTSAGRSGGGSGGAKLRGGSFLVTGGLGALGLAAAGWLLAEGASRIYLVSRSAAGVPAGAQRALSALLRHAPNDAMIIICRGDVAAMEDLSWWLHGIMSPPTGASLVPDSEPDFGLTCP